MRTKKAIIREIKPDSKYNSLKIAKLINYTIIDGKKSIAEKQVYKAFDLVSIKLKKKPTDIFEQVVEILTPQMEVRSRRVGGASYQVPMPIKNNRGLCLVLRWLVGESRKRSNKDYHTFAEKLASEMIDALDNKGGAFSKKETSHRMAESNKAFSHFRW